MPSGFTLASYPVNPLLIRLREKQMKSSLGFSLILSSRSQSKILAHALISLSELSRKFNLDFFSKSFNYAETNPTVKNIAKNDTTHLRVISSPVSIDSRFCVFVIQKTGSFRAGNCIDIEAFQLLFNYPLQSNVAWQIP